MYCLLLACLWGDGRASNRLITWRAPNNKYIMLPPRCAWEETRQRPFSQRTPNVNPMMINLWQEEQASISHELKNSNKTTLKRWKSETYKPTVQHKKTAQQFFAALRKTPSPRHSDDPGSPRPVIGTTPRAAAINRRSRDRLTGTLLCPHFPEHAQTRRAGKQRHHPPDAVELPGLA